MNETILVVDDDEIVRSGLQANLEQQGFRVTAATGGGEALRAIEQEKPALALCDLVLGDINGIELMKKIHALRPETAVIIITGHGTIKNALEALRNGAADYIQKPATPEEVIHRIRSVLHAIHLRSTLESERATMELKKRETSQQRMRHDRMTAVGIMAEGAARALNEILRPVLNYAPAVRDALPRDNPARELIAEIEEAGMKAGELLGDLHYIGAGTGITKTPLDITTFISSITTGPAATALHEMRPNVKLQLHELRSTAPIEASAPMLERALNNLITFAAEPLTQADATISISIATAVIDKPSPAYGPAKPGNYVAIVISDNGPGLPVEDLDRLFEPFYTMRLSRTISGLALPLVYRVIADHGGSLDVTSAPGRGTSFMIHLPASGTLTADTETIELRPDYSGGETILVVDDSAVHRELATGILTSQGYHVVVADSAQSALAQFTEAPADAAAPQIDLAVIDFVLASPLDGLDTFRAITKVQPRQKAILASGFADLARLTEAKRSGISKVIPKPYTHDSLTRAVREALDE